MMHSAPLAPGSRPGLFLVARGHCTLPPRPARREPHLAGAAAAKTHQRRSYGLGKPICPQLPTRGLAFSDVGAVRTRRSQNAHGFGSGPSAAEKIFLLKSILNMHFLQSGGAAHLAGANNSDHPPDSQRWRGTKEKRCLV